MALKAENWNGWTCLKINSSRRCSEGVSKYSQVSVGVKTTAIFKTHLVEKKYQWYGHRASSWDYNPIEVVLVCWWNCSVGIYGLRRHSPGALNIKSLWLTSVSVFSRECWWLLNFKIHPGTSTEHFSRKNSLFATPFFSQKQKNITLSRENEGPTPNVYAAHSTYICRSLVVNASQYSMRGALWTPAPPSQKLFQNKNHIPWYDCGTTF